MTARDPTTSRWGSRRDTLRMIAASGAASMAGPAIVPAVAAPAKTLFGSMVTIDHNANQAYRDAVRRYCQVIVPEGGLLWNGLRPGPTDFWFGAGDQFVAFGAENGLAMRGHTLVWDHEMPAWTREIKTANAAIAALMLHVETTMAHYAGKISSWNVINEPLPEDTEAPTDRRPSLWQRLLGEPHFALALHTAERAAPGTELVINEYDLEFKGARYDRKRRAMLDLVTRLKRVGAPLDAVGLQAHLRGERDIDRAALQRFIRELSKLGLGVLLTEMDVHDYALPGDVAERDAAVAARADELLDAVFGVVTPRAVLTWGLTDRYCWIPDYFKRPDGMKNRPLPLDEDYAPKPFMRVLDRYRSK